ncbi:MAG: UvrD-helicase domain-containing protein, partial [Clostridia bacterium]|nr:UvrD-helicase domain-containing protein [Clostridia bacterium]
MTEFQKWRRAIQEGAFQNLNNRQLEAVFYVNGPLLILAGAGSGKTTVLIQRIANMVRFGDAYYSDWEPEHTEEDVEHLKKVAQGMEKPNAHTWELCAVDPCPAWRILAITFTNKAAGELKERLSRTLGPEGEEVCAGTFHSFCARLLRQEGEALGYSNHFTIYDTDDSKRLLKECYKQLGIDEKVINIKETMGEISRAKDSLCSPKEFELESGYDYRLKKIASLYALYQQKLKEADAMDFDDLLYKTVELFHSYGEILQ